MSDTKKAWTVLITNTAAFTVCFACWMCYSILLAHLVNAGEFNWSAAQIGSLMAVPLLTGSLVRLPLGVLTDKYGGRIVFTLLMVLSAIPMYLVSRAQSYADFWWAGLGFGLTGGSFAVGVAYSSVWFPRDKQGAALGIFGLGNMGAALTSLFAPLLLKSLPDWRALPKIYAGLLLLTAVIFYFFTTPKKIEASLERSLLQRLAPLKVVRVWRFGLYYILVFGAFVGLINWLPSYYGNVYKFNLAEVGSLTSLFVIPAGLFRAFGGWLSDRWGARSVMYRILMTCVIGFSLLTLPTSSMPAPLLTVIVVLIGAAMGIGMGAVYKHIPDYFPTQVGVVGGMVGVMGGLGGYFCSKIFGFLLEWSNLWTSCWAFLALLSGVCLGWMHLVIKRMKMVDGLIREHHVYSPQ